MLQVRHATLKSLLVLKVSMVSRRRNTTYLALQNERLERHTVTDARAHAETQFDKRRSFNGGDVCWFRASWHSRGICQEQVDRLDLRIPDAQKGFQTSSPPP